ncbi:MAG: hypothetical protein K940chlam7_01444, partial [Chlamydiae bacterium]|nr:hypothetical protein [Chlamydiota bacterium]
MLEQVHELILVPKIISSTKADVLFRMSQGLSFGLAL